MAQVVIADAGPLIALARLERLSLLQDLFGTVFVPNAVYQECLAKPSADSQFIEQAVEKGFLVIHPETTHYLSHPRSLGLGEIAAIDLALSLPNALLILDDRLARKRAAKLELAFVGTVRLLDIAEKKGLIESAQNSIEALNKQGYRISLKILDELRSM